MHLRNFRRDTQIIRESAAGAGVSIMLGIHLERRILSDELQFFALVL